MSLCASSEVGGFCRFKNCTLHTHFFPGAFKENKPDNATNIPDGRLSMVACVFHHGRLEAEVAVCRVNFSQFRLIPGQSVYTGTSRLHSEALSQKIASFQEVFVVPVILK